MGYFEQYEQRFIDHARSGVMNYIVSNAHDMRTEVLKAAKVAARNNKEIREYIDAILRCR